MKKILPFAAAAAMLLCSCGDHAVLSAEPDSYETAEHRSSEHTNEPADTAPAYTEEQEPAPPAYDDLIVPADTDFNYVMTEDDVAVQRLLNEKKELAEQCLIFYCDNVSAYREVTSREELVITVTFPDDPSGGEYEYCLQSAELPFRTVAELETCFHECFSEDVAEKYLKYLCSEGYIYDPDGYHIPIVIERGGRLYKWDSYLSLDRSHNWDLIKVIDKTDEEIVFSFIDEVRYEPENVEAFWGKLKYEDGEWKYAWDMMWEGYDCPPEYGGFHAIWGM